jgi:hypothetical protein
MAQGFRWHHKKETFKGLFLFYPEPDGLHFSACMHVFSEKQTTFVKTWRITNGFSEDSIH